MAKARKHAGKRPGIDPTHDRPDVIGPALAELLDYLAAILPKVDADALKNDDSPRRGALYCFLFGAVHGSAVTHKLSPATAYANALCLFARLLPNAQEETVEEIVRWAAQSTSSASPWNPITHEGIDEFLGWRGNRPGYAFGRVNPALLNAPDEE
jgi:hypothetical protein